MENKKMAPQKVVFMLMLGPITFKNRALVAELEKSRRLIARLVRSTQQNNEMKHKTTQSSTTNFTKTDSRSARSNAPRPK